MVCSCVFSEGWPYELAGISLFPKAGCSGCRPGEKLSGECNAKRILFYGVSVKARKVLAGVVIAAAVVLAVTVVWLTGQSGLTALDPPEPAPSSVSAPEPEPAPSEAINPPTAAEVVDLEAALRSADADRISQYVPTGPGQALDANFPAQLALMELSMDPDSLQEAAPGVWKVTARDVSGGTWTVGLVRRGEQLVMFSAEKGGAE